MLQMVKTLAQFTIALEDMRDLGPAAASGEPAGSSGADAEEPGEAQVRGGGETAREPGPRPRTQRTRAWGGVGRCWDAGPATRTRHTEPDLSLGAQGLVMGAGRRAGSLNRGGGPVP